MKDEIDVKNIHKNVNKLTNKEKNTLIKTLLGVSGRLSAFLINLQEKISKPLPVEIHYMMLLAISNLRSLSSLERSLEIVDMPPNLDKYDDKLIYLLKQLNEIYKDELK